MSSRAPVTTVTLHQLQAKPCEIDRTEEQVKQASKRLFHPMPAACSSSRLSSVYYHITRRSFLQTGKLQSLVGVIVGTL